MFFSTATLGFSIEDFGFDEGDLFSAAVDQLESSQARSMPNILQEVHIKTTLLATFVDEDVYAAILEAEGPYTPLSKVVQAYDLASSPVTSHDDVLAGVTDLAHGAADDFFKLLQQPGSGGGENLQGKQGEDGNGELSQSR